MSVRVVPACAWKEWRSVPMPHWTSPESALQMLEPRYMHRRIDLRDGYTLYYSDEGRYNFHLGVFGDVYVMKLDPVSGLIKETDPYIADLLLFQVAHAGSRGLFTSLEEQVAAALSSDEDGSD